MRRGNARWATGLSARAPPVCSPDSKDRVWLHGEVPVKSEMVRAGEGGTRTGGPENVREEQWGRDPGLSASSAGVHTGAGPDHSYLWCCNGLAHHSWRGPGVPSNRNNST